ncbi:MAG: DUF3127 domain-containing protein [Cytophagales bacterium]|jgi:single-stranded DNA-binding protein|nr:DUF3127 domain-containing protein [Cytophagales bacterium]
MNIVGKIYEISEEYQITESFKKREFVLEHTEKSLYTEYIKFEMTNDRCELLNSFKVGDEVEVGFNIKGRKWADQEGKTKYFVSLQAWRISEYTGERKNENLQNSETQHQGHLEEEDDLPF